GLAIGRVRVWNPSREARASSPETDEPLSTIVGTITEGTEDARRMEAHKAPGKVREVWNNPILWREMRTWAYGRKILIVRIGYLLVVAVSALALYSILQDDFRSFGT